MRSRNLPCTARAPEPKRRLGRGKAIRLAITMIVILVAVVAGGAYGFTRYRVSRLARVVRESFAAGKYDAARKPLAQWLAAQPGSGEAQYFRAWDALAHDQPREAVEAVDRARQLGFDPEQLDCLTAIYDSRADRFTQALPVLEQAFIEEIGPQEMVAKELARIYLMSYRLDRAARAIERWRALAPDDPDPCLWSNEIASRSNAETAVLIQNFRAALERDPNLDKARLGLAQALSKDRRFDEAEQEYLAYEERRPGDTAPLLGLGRNAFQQGNIDEADRYFTRAIQASPRDPEILKELGQIDLRLGRIDQACRHFELLNEIEPYDHEARYSYAQALKLAGRTEQSRKELDQATRLRKEHDELIQLRYSVLKNPGDLDSRWKVAKWMIEHGHEDEGLKWTKEILRANPRHAPTHRTLADYYAKHGQAGLANYHRYSAGEESNGGKP